MVTDQYRQLFLQTHVSIVVAEINCLNNVPARAQKFATANARSHRTHEFPTVETD